MGFCLLLNENKAYKNRLENSVAIKADIVDVVYRYRKYGDSGWDCNIIYEYNDKIYKDTIFCDDFPYRTMTINVDRNTGIVIPEANKYATFLIVVGVFYWILNSKDFFVGKICKKMSKEQDEG